MKLTLVTINLNDAQGLQKTLSSVWERQTFSDLEQIVIDGGSTDGSVDVIKKFADKLAYWVSEPDSGIYNAMNKGIVRAKGDYLLFLNSGDWLDDDVLSKVFSQSLADDIVYGNYTRVEKDGHRSSMIYKRPFNCVDLLLYSVGHPASFIKRELFDCELYNEDFRIVSDWAFFVKQIIGNGCSISHVNLNVSFFNSYGITSKPEMQKLATEESIRFLTDNFGPGIAELYKDVRRREDIFGYLSKWRVKEFLDSPWLLKYTSKCVNVLFWLKQILGIKR